MIQNGQLIFQGVSKYSDFAKWFEKIENKKILLVTGDSGKKLFENSEIKKIINNNTYTINIFQDFEVNPTIENVSKGVEIFHQTNANLIMAFGGGSAIDVAKCIKLFASMNNGESFLTQEINSEIPIPLIAIPTTAGTGAESTQFAVIYKEGSKLSVSHPEGVPNVAILDETYLLSLPKYQRYATALDVLAHGIESYWSKNANEESREYSLSALRMFINNYDKYVANETEGNRNMLYASNYAGKAINISKTTAIHAMCYKISTLYNIAHGHALGLCIPVVLTTIVKKSENIPRTDKVQFDQLMNEIFKVLNVTTVFELSDRIEEIVYREFHLQNPINIAEDLDILCENVNVERLQNSPIFLDDEDIREMYINISKKGR